MGIGSGNSGRLDLSLRVPARRYSLGTDNWVTISDCGSLRLDAGQAVTVGMLPTGQELTVSRRGWGYEVSLPAKEHADLAIAGRSPQRLHLLMRALDKAADLEEYLRREEMVHRAALDELVP